MGIEIFKALDKVIIILEKAIKILKKAIKMNTLTEELILGKNAS